MPDPDVLLMQRLHDDHAVALWRYCRRLVPTDQGRAELDHWLGAAEDPGPYAADELVRKAITALHVKADADGFLLRQRAVHLSVMRELTARRAEAEEIGTRIAIDHTIAHLDADLRWLEETRDRVLRSEGTR